MFIQKMCNKGITTNHRMIRMRIDNFIHFKSVKLTMSVLLVLFYLFQFKEDLLSSFLFTLRTSSCSSSLSRRLDRMLPLTVACLQLKNGAQPELSASLTVSPSPAIFPPLSCYLAC